MFLPSICLVPAGLFGHSCFNLCSLLEKVNNLLYILLDFKVAKWTVSSLTYCPNPFQVNIFISRFMSNIAQYSKCTDREKTSEKRNIKILSFQICVVTNLSAPICFCLCSFCFWGEVSNSWILIDISRNSLLGNRKKMAKFLMRTFTCRSTFLYECPLTLPP